MELLNLLRDQPRSRQQAMMLQTVIGAVSTTAILAVVTMAAQTAAHGSPSLLLAFVLMAAVMIYTLSQNAVMTASARQVEQVIHRIRVDLFQSIRRSNPEVLEHVGRQPLYAALTKTTQTISQSLPLLVIGVQQVVLLVFVSFYLAYLSLPAFGLAMLFSVVAISVHMRRMNELAVMRRKAKADEARLFDSLRGILSGFKELRMSAARSDALMADFAALSREAQTAQTSIQKRWALEFALIQVVFYVLVGLMVFVVPIFAKDYHEVVVPATTAALFMIGPIGTITQAIPAITEIEASLAGIRALQRRMGEALDVAPDEHAVPLDGLVETIQLRALRFTYEDADGTPGFSVGPLDATFRAGEVTFITGGNGAGKSTMLRLLTGLTPARSGHLVINGHALSRAQAQAYRDQIAAIFSDYHLFRQLYGVDERSAGHAAALLERMDILDKVEVRDGAFTTVDLSTGQRKRLALVLAELEDKPVIVLDEWAADQDPHFRKIFYQEILPGLKARRKIVICVTHDDHYFDTADHILHMDEGRLTPAAA